ncbi:MULTISPECIES: acyl-CoA dehydrogenase family protein [unclassified Nocardioides]|uniref:acyl-CoA dehydrogenase family protein n=1 Tax=unclassified Nocardioides TaxID=2615069 RepID=UPI0006F4D1FB|nr:MULTISPECIES: acyl-CoA dehydrogenase family protein [unclassified Nocardioides]KQY51605.1 acyl-CoA dehydrogenase [Nocardioides sp. Root140]KRF10993.1 acyl-CoA dehydrogenase [Nocardioides sp. Soil796]
MNLADRDPALRPLLDALMPADDRARLETVLDDLGELAGTELDALAATADRNPPTLRQFAADGTRVDEVEYHPAYRRMSEIAFETFGLAAMSHRSGVFGWPTRTPHLVKYAVSYLFVQSEFGLACPVSMTDSAARVLRLFDPESFADEIDALSSTDMDTLATGAMFMTEKQAGTDIGQTETVATDHGDHWTLTGHKWFCSNVSADVILTLAQVPGQGTGTRGVGMFMVPKFRPDGTRNTFRIERLKDKLGTRSMASGEVSLESAYARPVGDLTRGFLQMAEMLNVSRLSNAMRASALMRRAVRESIDHTRQRVVFGRTLFDQPLMRATLLPLMLDAEASLGLVLEASERLDAADAGDERAAALIRILTPLAKHTVCKRARTVTGEAMEIRGGNGYIEDWVNPRLVRDAHLGSIWEGSSNVIALDVLRCMRKEQGHQVVTGTYLDRLAALDEPAVKPMADDLTLRFRALQARGDALLAADADSQQVGIAAYVDDLCHTVVATLLLEQAQREIVVGLGHRKLLLAHTALHRIVAGRLVETPALTALEQIADGGEVAADLARAAYDAIPSTTEVSTRA